MTDEDKDDISNRQRDVQRLLGRCVIRLQQIERLLKSIVATHAISGTAQTLLYELDARKLEVSDKTLGTMISRFLTDYVVPEGCESSRQTQSVNDEAASFSLHMQVNLPRSGYEILKSDLQELVALRNTLVHHFIDQHDLRTSDGCHRASALLVRSYEEIDRQFGRLRSFAVQMDQSKKKLAELVQTPDFHDMVVNGIDPNGKVHWPMAGIVSALREASSELAVDGWTSLDAAARWVSEQRPEQTPQKYGCSRWRHVLHECGEFELRRFAHNGQFGAWFRRRLDSSG